MRTLFFVAVSAFFLLVTGANAASLTVSTDQSVYDVGDLVAITVTGTSSPTEADTAIFAEVLFDSSLAFVSSAQIQATSFNGGLVWTSGALTHGPGSARAINQIGPLQPLPIDGPVAGTVVLQATAAGIFAATIEPSWADFFGATPGSPALFTVVPEPTTAALLTLGLLGLSLHRRH